MEPKRCAIWVRVSTDEQESGNQLAELRQWAARRGLEVAAEYVADGASAWKGEHREQLAAALAGARLGKYGVLLVWALDRLDREGVESTLGLLRRFHEAASRSGRCASRGPRPPTRTPPSCSARSTRGWPVPSPPAAASASGPGSPGAGPKASQSAAAPVPRTASPAGAAATTDDGNASEPAIERQAEPWQRSGRKISAGPSGIGENPARNMSVTATMVTAMAITRTPGSPGDAARRPGARAWAISRAPTANLLARARRAESHGDGRTALPRCPGKGSRHGSRWRTATNRGS